MAELVLQYEAPFGATRKFWLRSGERVVVGSSCWADHTVEHDRLLSPVHFAIEHAGTRALIRDLNSDAGISCNGRHGAEFILHDGDKIYAGETQFVAFVGERLTKSTVKNKSNSLGGSDSNTIEYVFQLQSNGLTKFTTSEAHSAASFANALLAKFNVVAVATKQAFDSLPPPWKASGIPVGGGSMLLELVDVRDSIVLGLIAKSHEYTLLASESSFESIRQLVISMSMLRMQCRILRAQLISGPGHYIESLLPGIHAVMLPENPSSGVMLFAKTQSETPWVDIGCPGPRSNAYSNT